jgi:hypothetical protein
MAIKITFILYEIYCDDKLTRGMSTERDGGQKAIVT